VIARGPDADHRTGQRRRGGRTTVGFHTCHEVGKIDLPATEDVRAALESRLKHHDDASEVLRRRRRLGILAASAVLADCHRVPFCGEGPWTRTSEDLRSASRRSPCERLTLRSSEATIYSPGMRERRAQEPEGEG
jgi:hypothetical protein